MNAEEQVKLELLIKKMVSVMEDDHSHTMMMTALCILLVSVHKDAGNVSNDDFIECVVNSLREILK